MSGEPRGQLYEVCRRWIEIVLDELGHGFALKTAFTNHEAEFFQAPYKGDPGWMKHLKHSTCLPALGVPVFALREFDHLDVTPVFDDTGNLRDKAAFSDGLRLAERRAKDRRRRYARHYPTLTFDDIRYVSSDPLTYEDYVSGEITDLEGRMHSEFVQLVDLVLGSTKTAIVGARPGKHARLQLAHTVTSSMARQWAHPWHRFARRARSFTVTIWPDEFGLPYNPQPYIEREEAAQASFWKLDIQRAA